MGDCGWKTLRLAFGVREGGCWEEKSSVFTFGAREGGSRWKTLRLAFGATEGWWWVEKPPVSCLGQEKGGGGLKPPPARIFE